MVFRITPVAFILLLADSRCRKVPSILSGAESGVTKARFVEERYITQPITASSAAIATPRYIRIFQKNASTSSILVVRALPWWLYVLSIHISAAARITAPIVADVRQIAPSGPTNKPDVTSPRTQRLKR